MFPGCGRWPYPGYKIHDSIEPHRTSFDLAHASVFFLPYRTNVARVSEAHPGLLVVVQHVSRVRPLALPGLQNPRLHRTASNVVRPCARFRILPAVSNQRSPGKRSAPGALGGGATCFPGAAVGLTRATTSPNPSWWIERCRPYAHHRIFPTASRPLHSLTSVHGQVSSKPHCGGNLFLHHHLA